MGHQVIWATAFLEGLARHGITGHIETPNQYHHADLSVMWSYRHKALMETGKANGCDSLIMERGFVGDRQENTALGFNGLNGNATFVYQGDKSERGRRFYDLIQPWKNPAEGDYYLICGQVLGDMSLANCPDYPAWLASLPRQHKSKPVRFRPHPVGFSYEVPHSHTQGTLAEDLAGARAMWCWNSNSAVDALLAGVHTVTFDKGSVVYEYTAHDLQTTVTPARVHMVNALASAQWQCAEIASGEAWEHLKHYYD